MYIFKGVSDEAEVTEPLRPTGTAVQSTSVITDFGYNGSLYNTSEDPL
jgi:hypothetical protein